MLSCHFCFLCIVCILILPDTVRDWRTLYQMKFNLANINRKQNFIATKHVNYIETAIDWILILCKLAA